MGTGWVAILSDGPPVLLNTGDAPTYADPQAAITWASSVQTSVKTDVKLKNFVGRGSASRYRWRSPGRAGCSCNRARAALCTHGAAAAAVGDCSGSSAE